MSASRVLFENKFSPLLATVPEHSAEVCCLKSKCRAHSHTQVIVTVIWSKQRHWRRDAKHSGNIADYIMMHITEKLLYITEKLLC